MDLNEYVYEYLLRERLAEARARAAIDALVRSRRPPHRPARAAVGAVLIRMRQWLAGSGAVEPGSQRTPAPTGTTLPP